MTKIVQLSGGNAAQQDAYSGLSRELTVDTSNNDLRVHDGVTPGGHRVQNQDNADARYQAKSLELDGLTGFSAEQRGFLVRLGPSDYRLRQLLVGTAALSVAYPDGYTGSPTISLNPVVTSNHEFGGTLLTSGVVSLGGVVTFTTQPEFTAGLVVTSGQFMVGDVIGDLTGDVLGDTTGTHTGPVVGSLDARGEALLLDDDQIPTSAIGGLAAFVEDHGIPNGVIVLWSGTSSNIPAGWVLCNGLNGSPDLRNKFVRGAGVGGGFEAAGTMGGVDEITPTGTIDSAGAHTHTLSGNVASSSTGVSLTKVFKQVDAANQTGCMDNVTLVDPGHLHALGGTATSNGAHAHAITLDSQENRPAYYALCYIMKV